MKGYRTVVFNFLAGIIPALEESNLAQVLPEEWLPYYMMFVAVGNIYLRSITDTPIGKKERKDA